jgi:hypothetical protein
MPPQDHWLPGFNFNVEEWDAKGPTYGTLAVCRTLALARAAFKLAIGEKPGPSNGSVPARPSVMRSLRPLKRGWTM